MTKKETIFVLLSITFCWSSSYIFIKDISQSFSAYTYLTLTSGLAAVSLSFAFRSQLRLLSRETLLKGFILSILIGGNIFFEKLALDHLSASAVSALASMNIILVPLILILKKQFPTKNNILGIIIIYVGLTVSGFMVFQGSGSIGILYAFASCLMMSLYTIVASEYTQRCNPLHLTTLQMWFNALLGLFLCIVLEPGSLSSIKWNIECISYLIIITFFSKVYAYVMLMYSEKYASPVTITVIAATSPVITLIFALIIPDLAGNTEVFTLKSLIGAIIIAGGAIVSGTDFLSPKPKSQAAEEITVDESADESAGQAKLPVKQNSPLRAFLSVLIIYTMLVVSIDVMEFADAYSKLRPASFIPIVAGLLFGPFGALACALGNLIQDLFWGGFGFTSILGMIGNFLAAYIPYKMWQAMSAEKMDAHTWRRIGLFLWTAFASCLTTAFVLSCGMEVFFSTSIPELFYGVFFNNFLFSMVFGLPTFILFTLNDTPLFNYTLTVRSRCGLSVLRNLSGHEKWFYITDTILLCVCFIASIFMHLDWSSSLVLRILVILTAAVVLVSCLIPKPEVISPR